MDLRAAPIPVRNNLKHTERSLGTWSFEAWAALSREFGASRHVTETSAVWYISREGRAGIHNAVDLYSRGLVFEAVRLFDGPVMVAVGVVASGEVVAGLVMEGPVGPRCQRMTKYSERRSR